MMWFPTITAFILVATTLQEGYALPPEIINSPLGQTADLEARLQYLRKYSYLPVSDGNSNDALLQLNDVQTSIRRMQEYGGILQTGLFDAATIELMNTSRCGVPDPVDVAQDGEALGGRLKRYAHTGAKWETNEIVFRILNTAGHDQITPAESKAAIRRAFKTWSDVTPLIFREVNEGFADIYLKFGPGYHGDQYPFDGYGGTLAHAYPPMSGFGDLDGDVHFDDSEPFTVNTVDGINLDFVSAHEIGHALGLAHSNVATALMAPYYQGYNPNFQLPDDDRIGMQILYGPNPGTGPVNPAPTTPTATRPGAGSGASSCNTLTFSGIGYIRQELFAYQGDKYWRIRAPKDVLTDIKGDQLIHFWYDLPADINAAYERYHDQHIIFFKGTEYWEYDSLYPISGFPKPISQLSTDLPTNVDAVMTYNEFYKTYFFKGDMVWRFDEGTKTVDVNWPFPIAEIFPGIPANLDAAFRYKDGIPIFVKGTQYYVYNDATRAVDPGYPKSFGEDFLGCRPGQLEGPNAASMTQPSALLGIVLGTFLMVLNQLW